MMTWLKSCGKCISLGVCGLALMMGPNSAQAATKNVILMISDGQGFNTVKATDYYTGAPAVYESFDVKYGMQTNSANNPAGYDPALMAADFNYAKSGATDSASAATAMYTGRKNYDGQINWSTSGQPIKTFFEKAAKQGMSIGAVSSVPISHATPAAVYGHNKSRNNYAEIAAEAVYGSNPVANNGFYNAGNYNGYLKVIMGAGHPDYDDNNSYQPGVSDNYVGGSQAWTDLANGVSGWARIDGKAAFQSLASGPTPDKVFGVAKVNSTLQNNRTGADPADPPYADPLNANVPSLVDMTKAALNVLDNNSNGFAVMIEGGAIDWANHSNLLGRMIEEQIDFNASVQAAVDWVNTHSNWNETLLIVTADHECGHLWGPGGLDYLDNNTNGTYNSGIDTFLGYRQIVDNGVGALPGAEYFSNNHTNALVPLFAKGAGSELFAGFVTGTDANLAAMYGLDASWAGQYVDNTSIYGVMTQATNVPEPAVSIMLGVGLPLLLRRRRKA